MQTSTFAARSLAFAAVVLQAFTGVTNAQEPGVDVATPRFAISLVDDSFRFLTPRLVIEQGDWVRWRNIGLSVFHTTTSGSGCLPDGLWNANLSPGVQFTRRFLEPPKRIPYFCSPHCGVGMVGEVVVTDLIHVRARDSAGSLSLVWTGGSPELSNVYRVFRSPNAAFTGPLVQTFPPDLGDTGTTFTDGQQPGRGEVLFYLVMNKF